MHTQRKDETPPQNDFDPNDARSSQSTIVAKMGGWNYFYKNDVTTKEEIHSFNRVFARQAVKVRESL